VKAAETSGNVTYCNEPRVGNAAMQYAPLQAISPYISGVKWFPWANEFANAPSLGWNSPFPMSIDTGDQNEHVK